MGSQSKMEKVNLYEKFTLFNEYWRPKIVGEINSSYVKLAKLKGEFVWHHHDEEDEMFLVVKGKLMIRFRNSDVVLRDSEFLIIPKGIEHMPVAEEEVWVLLIEPSSTLNTGDIVNERTIEDLEWI